MFAEGRGEYPWLWATIESIAAKIGCPTQTLFNRVHQHERDTGQRQGPPPSEMQRVKELEREVKELR